MNQKKVKLGLILLSGFGLAGLQAQVSVPGSGGNASGSGGTVSYSVGQLVYSTNTGTNGSVTQGVQQTYTISVATGIDEKTIDLSYTAYPNPTTDGLHLKLTGFLASTYNYQLFDMSGKMIETRAITEEETILSMKTCTGGTYLLKIIETKAGSAKEVKSFKIIKK
jgi:hypothetical protein